MLRPFAIELGVRIGGRGVGGVRARRAAEVRLSIAPARRQRRLVAAGAISRTLGQPEALHRRPRLDQRVVDAEVLARQKSLHSGLSQRGRHEPRGGVAGQKPVAVLQERRVIPNQIINAEPDEPPKQEITPSQPINWRCERIE
jgi:hypothetical protein